MIYDRILECFLVCVNSCGIETEYRETSLITSYHGTKEKFFKMVTQRENEVRGLFARVRLNEIVSKFIGEGDVGAWTMQVRIAKSVMRLEDADLSDLASLALKDRAFAIYEEMEEGDKMDFEKIAVE